MNKNYKFTVLAIVTSLLFACVQVPVEQAQNNSQLALSSVRDLAITYPAQSTFALSPRYLEKVSLKPEQQKVIYQWYHNAIVNNLEKHQYIQNKSVAQVQFYVGFGIALDEDFNDKDIAEKFGITPGLHATGQHKKGSFLIYIDDATTGKRVWRGAVQGFVQEKLTKAERLERIENVVELVLKQFYNQ